MGNSLIYKLMGAFLLVIAAGALAISTLTSRATQNAFSIYTTRSGQVWAERLAPVLADYYLETNGWQGVESILQADVSGQYAPGGAGNIMGQGRGSGSGRQSTDPLLMTTGQRLILADERGIVISDSQTELIGYQISTSGLQNGVPIIVDKRLVGTLIITLDSQAGTITPAGEFLASVDQAIINTTALVGVIAILVGAVLFLQITSPLRQLKKAATAIAHGDLKQRVSIRSRDELGELGLSFNMMAESLSKAETQRQHLIADIAHELRTPLTAMQGTLEGIQDGILPFDDEQVNALYTETTLLNRLVGDLRLLSLAEAGHLKLELQETDPSEMIQQIIERMKPEANLNGISLELENDADIPAIRLDPDRIAQVLGNLISNAVRYTPPAGIIKVKSEYLTQTNMLQISVTDTGTGIDREDLPHIFNRFYRADKSRTRGSGGSGLGLAIVKQLIEAHGGEVTGESPIFRDDTNPGYGARFTITLPCRPIPSGDI